jgi:hypothetical protein
MEPTPAEIADMKAHSMHQTFLDWSSDQRSVYLAVLRGSTDAKSVAAALGWPPEKTAAVLDSMYGDLLWDRSRPNARIHLRD